MGQGTKPTYRTDAGRLALLAVYDRWLALLPAGVRRIEVQTRLGPTNVLVAGPEDAPPLIIHQSGNFPNPATLHWFAPLMTCFRVYAPDLPGAPGYSAPHHLDGRKRAAWVGARRARRAGSGECAASGRLLRGRDHP